MSYRIRTATAGLTARRNSETPNCEHAPETDGVFLPARATMSP